MASISEEKGSGRWPHRVVHFEAVEGFVGVTRGTVDVRTGMGGGDCGYGFVAGESYFVYAGWAKEGELWVSDCGATKSLAKAHTDLAYARQVSRGGDGALLFGRVIGSARGGLQDRLEQTGIANVKVTAEGPASQHLAAVTDAEGFFSFAGSHEGTYTVRAAVPDRFPGIAPWEVTVPAGDCKGLVLESNALASLTGRVMGAGGNPTYGLEIKLIPADAAASMAEEESRTSSGGRYSWEHLPPGSYILVVSPTEPSDLLGDAPYPKTFFPRGGSVAEAERIVLRPAEGRTLPDFVVQPRATRAVTGVVRWPDGRPAAGVEVTLFFNHLGRGDTTDDEGRFKLNAYEGYTYELTAMLAVTQDTAALAEPQNVGIGAEDLDIDLVLTRKVERVVASPMHGEIHN
ncbi:MAG TPA: carboxypeptidase-like regulatory domain-containing protein [Thermoanaerobaculia bacterium]